MALDRRRLIATAAIVATMGLGVAGGAAAQDATPASGTPAAQAAGFPNHIHKGTCQNLGEIVAPLANLEYRGTSMGGMMGGTPEAAGAAMATPMAGMSGEGAVPVAVGVTVVPIALADIIAGGHSINVHKSAEEIQTYVACGEIQGTPDEQGNLFIGLREQNGSGLSGIAWLLDDGSGKGTTVTVFVGNFGGMGGGMMATPTA